MCIRDRSDGVRHCGGQYMEFIKQCSTCDFNFSGKCGSSGNMIPDITQSCSDWEESQDYYAVMYQNCLLYTSRQVHRQMEDGVLHAVQCCPHLVHLPDAALLGGLFGRFHRDRAFDEDAPCLLYTSLNRVVLPQFWLPASAKVRVCLLYTSRCV